MKKLLTISTLSILSGLLIFLFVLPNEASAVETYGDNSFYMDPNYNFASQSALYENIHGETVRYAMSSPTTITYEFSTSLDLINCVFDFEDYPKTGQLQDLGGDNYKCTTTLSESEYTIDYAVTIVIRYQFEEGGDWYTNAYAVKALYDGFNTYTPEISNVMDSVSKFEVMYHYSDQSGTIPQKLELFSSKDNGSYLKVNDCEKSPSHWGYICEYDNADDGNYSFYLLVTDELGRTEKSNVMSFERSRSATTTASTVANDIETNNANDTEENVVETESGEEAEKEEDTSGDKEEASTDEKSSEESKDDKEESLPSKVFGALGAGNESVGALVFTLIVIGSFTGVALLSVFGFRKYKESKSTKKPEKNKEEKVEKKK